MSESVVNFRAGHPTPHPSNPSFNPSSPLKPLKSLGACNHLTSGVVHWVQLKQVGNGVVVREEVSTLSLSLSASTKQNMRHGATQGATSSNSVARSFAVEAKTHCCSARVWAGIYRVFALLCVVFSAFVIMSTKKEAARFNTDELHQQASEDKLSRFVQFPLSART